MGGGREGGEGVEPLSLPSLYALTRRMYIYVGVKIHRALSLNNDPRLYGLLTNGTISSVGDRKTCIQMRQYKYHR
jgi:hypothetical protein